MDKEESTEKNHSIEQTPENNGSNQKITVGNTPLLNKISIQETYETNEEAGPGTNNEGMHYAYDDKENSQMNEEVYNEDQEDLDAVIESISYGKTQSVKKMQFQAFTAAIAHEDQVKFVVDYLNNVNNTTHSKFPSAKNRILAYRVAQMD